MEPFIFIDDEYQFLLDVSRETGDTFTWCLFGSGPNEPPPGHIIERGGPVSDEWAAQACGVTALLRHRVLRLTVSR